MKEKTRREVLVGGAAVVAAGVLSRFHLGGGLAGPDSASATVGSGTGTTTVHKNVVCLDVWYDDVNKVMHCYPGHFMSCYTPVVASPTGLAPIPDSGLAACMARINAVLAATARGDKRALRILHTDYGPVLAWSGGVTVQPPKGALTPESNPNKFDQAIGLDTTKPKPKVQHWAWGGYQNQSIICPADSTNVCEVDKGLVIVKNLTPTHDAKLRVATNEINSIVDEYYSVNQRHHPGQHLSMMIAPSGFFLGWAAPYAMTTTTTTVPPTTTTMPATTTTRGGIPG